MKVLYVNRQQLFSVEQDDCGDLYLCVVIGGIAMSERKIPMDDRLIEIYRANPEQLIGKVNEIRHAV